MGVPTYLPIANITAGSSVSIVTFSGITQQYRDLVLVINGKAVAGSGLGIFITLNNDFGANYNEVSMEGSGSSATSFSVSNATASTLAPANTNDGNYVLNFIDYSATDKHKSFLSRNDVSATGTRAMSHRWANNSAITSIRVAISSSTFTTGSTFALYGVLA